MPEPEKAPSQEPVVQGGPAEAPPATPEPQADQPKLVTIRMHGQEFSMSEDAARAWQEREQTLSRQGQELGEYRRRWQQVEQTVQPAQPAEPDLNTLWFENPAKAAEIIQERTYKRVRSEYEAEQRERGFWESFYRKHDDLREDDWIVEAQLKRHLRTLADLPVAEAQERLADLTRNEILRLSRKGRGASSEPSARADLVEPASGDRAPRRPVNPDEDAGPNTMSELIRQRRAQKRTAQKGA